MLSVIKYHGCVADAMVLLKTKSLDTFSTVTSHDTSVVIAYNITLNIRYALQFWTLSLNISPKKDIKI